MSKDWGQLKTFFTIRKFKNKEDHEAGKVHEISKFEKNIFLTAGIEKIWKLMAGIDTSGYFSNANAYIGVGNNDGSVSEDASQTALQGASVDYEAMDSGFPQVGYDTNSNNTITYYATFGDSVANFAWEEFTVANGGSNSDVLINRKVSSQGTKVSGAIWEFQVDLQIT